ncbi:MAG: tetratricopeptide repeat protein [Alphaproteobacteria bacterium]|nr:tetratricopeptide repeat protein [Alphaproteobacteria bacterium]
MTTIRSLSSCSGLGVPIAVLPGCGPKTPPPEEVIPDEQITDPAVTSSSGALTALQTETRMTTRRPYNDFKRAPSLAPDNAKVQFNAGWTAQRASASRTSRRATTSKALEIDPAYNNALVNYAALLTEVDRYDDAVGIYDAFRRGQARRPRVRNSLVEALTRALAASTTPSPPAQQILLVDPENVAAYRNLSRTYFAMGDYRMSLLCAEKAQTMNDGDAGIYNNIGVTYLKQGDIPRRDLEAFKTAIKLDPNNVEANLNLGFIALDAGDFDEALGCFEAVVKARPENIDGQLGYAVALRGTRSWTRRRRPTTSCWRWTPRTRWPTTTPSRCTRSTPRTSRRRRRWSRPTRSRSRVRSASTTPSSRSRSASSSPRPRRRPASRPRRSVSAAPRSSRRSR